MRVENEHEFAFWWMYLEMGRNLARGSNEMLFKFFRKFSHQGNFDIAEDLFNFFDELINIMWTGVKNLSCFFILKGFKQMYALGAFFGRKVLEGKVVGGHAATHEGCYHGAWARDRPDFDSFADAFTHKVECRVCNTRRACIAYESDVPFVLRYSTYFGVTFSLLKS